MWRRHNKYRLWLLNCWRVNYRSFGCSSLKSLLFLVVQSLTCSTFTMISSPCHRPCHNCIQSSQSIKQPRSWNIIQMTWQQLKGTDLPWLVLIDLGQEGKLLIINTSLLVEGTITWKSPNNNNPTKLLIWWTDFLLFTTLYSRGRVRMVPFQNVSL